MAWCRTALWIWLLATVYERCCSSPSTFSNSLNLTRTIRTRVQQLLMRYKEELLGDSHFDDKRIVLNTLPSITINYQTWLRMEDTERLYCASRNLRTFWTHLESQRQKLQGHSNGAGDRGTKKRNRRGRPSQSLAMSILGIQLDLRDLLRQVNSQLLKISTLKQKDDYTHTPLPATTTASSPTANPDVPSATTSTVSAPDSTHSALHLILSSTLRTTDVPSVSHPRRVKHSLEAVAVSSRWVSVLEGYVVLRDLERYLNRLVRDYTLLQAKS